MKLRARTIDTKHPMFKEIQYKESWFKKPEKMLMFMANSPSKESGIWYYGFTTVAYHKPSADFVAKTLTREVVRKFYQDQFKAYMSFMKNPPAGTTKMIEREDLKHGKQEIEAWISRDETDLLAVDQLWEMAIFGKWANVSDMILLLGQSMSGVCGAIAALLWMVFEAFSEGSTSSVLYAAYCTFMIITIYLLSICINSTREIVRRFAVQIRDQDLTLKSARKILSKCSKCGRRICECKKEEIKS